MERTTYALKCVRKRFVSDLAYYYLASLVECDLGGCNSAKIRAFRDTTIKQYIQCVTLSPSVTSLAEKNNNVCLLRLSESLW